MSAVRRVRGRVSRGAAGVVRADGGGPGAVPPVRRVRGGVPGGCAGGEGLRADGGRDRRRGGTAEGVLQADGRRRDADGRRLTSSP